MKMRARGLVLATVVAMAAGALGVRAEDKAPAPAPFVRASIASTDALNNFIKDLGIPIPVDAKAMIEQQFPFIGDGGLATDKPVGIVFIAGDDLPEQQMAVFGFPVKEGVATVEKFVEQGFKAEGKDIATQGEDVSFKRTANYLYMFAGASGGVKDYIDTFFTGDYKEKGTLAFMTVDMAAMRKAAPKKFAAFWEEIEAQADENSQDPNQKLGADAAMKFMREKIGGLNRITMSLSVADESLKLSSWFMPVEIEGTRVFPQPAFPKGTIFSLHVGYPNAQMSQWMTDSLNALDFTTEQEDGKKLTAEEAAKVKAFLTKASTLLFTVDAQSLGVRMSKDGEPVGMLVNQYGRDVNFAKEMGELVKEAEELRKAGDGKGPEMSITTSKGAKGGEVSRLTVTENQEKVFVDFVQTGKTVYLLINPAEGDSVEELAAMPAAGKITEVMAAKFDVGEFVNDPRFAGGPMGEEAVAKMQKALAGKSISWTVKHSAKDKFLYMDLSIPMAVLRAGGEVASQMLMPRPMPVEPGM